MSEQKKTILVTGSTDGIGLETATRLAMQGHRIILHGRNDKKIDEAISEIKLHYPNLELETIRADLSSLEEVKSMAAELNRRFDKLDVLINNAGIYMNKRELSRDGIEMTFAVNHLAHFALTLQLLDLLKKSAPSRIINVSSMAHTGSVSTFENYNFNTNFNSFASYSLSKLANILFTNELAERLNSTGVTVNCLHPGVIDTKLLRAGFGNFGGGSLEQGAKTSIYLALMEEVSDITGKYFSDSKIIKPSADAHNKELQKELWDLSVQLTGLDV